MSYHHKEAVADLSNSLLFYSGLVFTVLYLCVIRYYGKSMNQFYNKANQGGGIRTVEDAVCTAVCIDLLLRTKYNGIGKMFVQNDHINQRNRIVQIYIAINGSVCILTGRCG